ncbi:hypothetical protein MNBD_GAMMA23-652 [hydrothermal vent metagenome]|uniref:HPt domain-containing protein n=1 Tax=hydrothermal vent metagenome TaxID=652676 RepID=A0A3B0ZWJ9_9ZZZZ
MPESNAIDSNTIASLKEIMGDAFSMLINTFTDDTGKLIHSLTELQQQNDLDVFTRNAHSIKSSSANVGALQLSAIAAVLEARGKNGDISNTSALIEKLSTEFSHACDELNALN